MDPQSPEPQFPPELAPLARTATHAQADERFHAGFSRRIQWLTLAFGFSAALALGGRYRDWRPAGVAEFPLAGPGPREPGDGCVGPGRTTETSGSTEPLREVHRPLPIDRNHLICYC